MSYKDDYRSIQLNISKQKYQEMIDWLDVIIVEENRSLNSYIVSLLLKEFKRWQNEKH